MGWYVFEEVEALIAVGRLDDAARLLDRIAASDVRAASASRARGLLAAASGDLDRGERLLESSVVAADQAGCRYDEGRSLLALGLVQHRSRKKASAQRSLAAAADIFDRLELPLAADRARRELARISGDRAPARALTRHEARVAELVAAGKTNREIADALFVSVHTIEGVLSRVYRKLHVRSRTELATHWLRCQDSS